MNKLNGWVRIGIVLSVLWVLGAGIYTNKQVTEIAVDSSSLVYRLCTSSPPSDAEQTGFFKYCELKRDEIYQDAVHYRMRDVAIFSLGPLPIFWLIGFICVMTYRWIKKGFKAK